MTNKYLLGVDIGTYSSKGVLVSEDGKIAAMHVVEHGLEMPKPGYFEHDADKVWWHDFVEICHQILKTSNINPKDVLAVGTSAIGSCVLPIDKDGNALRPGILYGIDTRASAEIDELNQILGKDNIFNSNGSYLTSQASGPKILWIRNNEPEIYEKTRYFLTSEAYLVYKLTNKASIDIYTAGGYSPLFDPIKKEWIAERGKYITPIENLPDIYLPGEIVGNVTKDAAVITGLAEGTPVIAGTTDAAAEAVSAGVSQVGDMMVMFGSSIFFILKSARLIRTTKFWSSNFVEPGSFAFLGGMSTSGSLTRWFRDQLGQPEMDRENAGGENAYAALAKLAATSAKGANGLIALPYFEGERTPLHDPHACGMFFGLSLKHTRADLYRAILESVAYGIRHNLEGMRNEGVEAERILAVGGGTKNQEWMRIVSDVAGIKMGIPKQQIGASYGDAFMAGIGAGVFANYTEIHQWVEIGQEIEPDYTAHEVYDLNYSIFRELYDQTAYLMHKLR
ncbi:MAG: carbohydrate kinase [Anaerolineaceae bacterium]|jgi:xylulokinase|nr:MAG: carbohydrate kinase [Anaerolineaceae bacterium]